MSANSEVHLWSGRAHAVPATGARRLSWHSVSTSRTGNVRFAPDGTVAAAEGSRANGVLVPVSRHRDALELARAAALLDDGVPLRHAAALARLSLERAAAAADELARRGILAPGTPLRFVSRRKRAEIYGRIPVVLRGVRHAEAARMLAGEGADLDEVCAHLLAGEATGSLDVVVRLQAAAERAQHRGEPDLAIRYLSRALAETADVDVRRRVRHDLARAARVVRTRNASAEVAAALELCEDPDERAGMAGDLAEIRLFAGERAAARRAVGDSASDAGLQLALDAYDARRVEQADRAIDGLLVTAEATGRAGLCGVLSGVLAWRGEPGGSVRPLLRRCQVDASTWSEGDAQGVNQALLACSFLEDLGALRALIEQVGSVARSRGSIGAEALAVTHSAISHARCGALPDAETNLRRILELDREHAVSLMLPLAFCLAVDTLLERPDLAAALAPAVPPGLDDETLEGAMVHELRGRLALAHGSPAEARRELEQAAATYDALHLCSWRSSSWRCALALAVGQGDAEARGRAADLATAELAEARRSRSRRAIGVALRAQGLLEAGSRAIPHLEEAVAVLEQSSARLEHARALVDLGAALRRANRRDAARAPLRAGLESAEVCGAHRLRGRALLELRAAGARPRRTRLSGPAALTTAERRVAELAVAGLTNPEIARALFVTINTVEGHLRHVYQKLSIHSRRQLSEALGNDIAA